MSGLHELLNIDPRIERPNAYQIFGLEVLDDDSANIASAIKSTIARLKAAQANAIPDEWSSCAKSVSKAKEILLDPEKKAKYDTRLKSTFEPVAVASTAPSATVPASATSGPPTDILANYLPSEDPFAAFDMAAAIAEMPPEVDEDDLYLEDVLAEPESSHVAKVPASSNPFGASLPPTTAASEPVFKAPKKPLRRKKSGFPVAGMLMTLFVVGLFGGIGYCIMILMDREQSRTQQASAPAAEPRVEVVFRDDVRRSRDNVMGDLLPHDEGSPSPQMVTRDFSGDSYSLTLSNQDDGMMDSKPGQTEASMTQGSAMSDAPPEVGVESMQPSEMMDPTGGPPAAEMIAAADEAAAKARTAIRTRNWTTMLQLAEAALDMAQTDEQKAQASARRRLVHYADQYQQALDRSISRFQGGETFSIRGDIVVNVVEATDSELTVKFAGRVKTYERTMLPQIITNALAKDSLPDDPALLAAFEGAWRCLRENVKQDTREGIYAEWDEIAGQSPDANVEGLQAEVEAVFKN